MDVVEHEEPVAGSVAASQAVEPDETIFSVLAGRARSRAPSHLWLTAAIGGIDAVALMIGRPSLWWVAAACAAVAAYAVWGLVDRTLAVGAHPPGSWGYRGLRVVGALAMAAGFAGAVAAVLGFLVLSLGRAGPPG